MLYRTSRSCCLYLHLPQSKPPPPASSSAAAATDPVEAAMYCHIGLGPNRLTPQSYLRILLARRQSYQSYGYAGQKKEVS